MLTLNHLSYIHSYGEVLFNDLNFTINARGKIALIGNNGTGKSTLLKILAGELSPSAGTVVAESKPYCVPQHSGQFNELTVAQALRIDDKLSALTEIIAGNATEWNLALLNDDWLVEQRCYDALAKWKLEDLDLNQQMKTLSGGQKTKVFLSGIAIHQPQIVLLDEPSNHLDTFSRDILYHYVKTASETLIIVSHDRTLLNLSDTTYELSKRGIFAYGGNYDFYSEQKRVESNALNQELRSKEKELRRAKEIERESVERKQKLDARGKKKQEKAGLPTIAMKTFKNNAEKSTSRIKDVHAEKINNASQSLNQIRQQLPDIDKIKIDLSGITLHSGKKLFEARVINFQYDEHLLWKSPLSFFITSGERIAIKGNNGSGKTTLIRMLLGEIHPQCGTIDRAFIRSVYIDQDYSLINPHLTIYEQAQSFSNERLQEHEIKIRLNRFLFTKEDWNKPCEVLSGGEKMRLTLCCLMINDQAPDVMILDEPTNNLDIQNIEILTKAIEQYNGTLIVVSHDQRFLEQTGVHRDLRLD